MSNWKGLNRSNNTTISSLRILDVRIASVFNCGKKGHYSRDCWSKKKTVQSNTTTTNNRHQDELEWDTEALFTEMVQMEERSTSEIIEVPSFMATIIE